MDRLLMRGSRFAAAAAVLGALAVVPAHATNWDSLKTWDGKSAGAEASGDAQGMASVDKGGDAHYGVEIANAFESLGMPAERAECYGKVLVSQLTPDEQRQAAELVRTASNADSVRQNVMNAGPVMVGSFTAANEHCPEGVGG